MTCSYESHPSHALSRHHLSPISELVRVCILEDQVPSVEAGDGSGFHHIEHIVFMEKFPGVQDHWNGIDDHLAIILLMITIKTTIGSESKYFVLMFTFILSPSINTLTTLYLLQNNANDKPAFFTTNASRNKVQFHSNSNKNGSGKLQVLCKL